MVFRQGFTAHEPSNSRPIKSGHNKNKRPNIIGRYDSYKDDNQHNNRQDKNKVANTHNDVINPSAVKTGNQAEKDADNFGDNRYAECDENGIARSDNQLRQNRPTAEICTEQEFFAGYRELIP